MIISILKDKMEEILKEVVKNLVEGNYHKVIEESKEKRGNPDDIKSEIMSYPGNISLPPDTAYEDYESYDVENKNEKIVDFYLWFDGEKSDLMIQILVYTNKKRAYSFWDILVP